VNGRVLRDPADVFNQPPPLADYNPFEADRALARDPDAGAILLAEIRRGATGERLLAALADDLEDMLRGGGPGEAASRHLVERIALGLQASLLLRHAPGAVAEAFCESRLAGVGGRLFGTLGSAADCRAIVERATPRIP